MTASFDPESGELLLGDIMISIPKALEQAKAYGHSVKENTHFSCSQYAASSWDHMVDVGTTWNRNRGKHCSLQVGRDYFINEKGSHEKICKTDHSPGWQEASC